MWDDVQAAQELGSVQTLQIYTGRQHFYKVCVLQFREALQACFGPYNLDISDGMFQPLCCHSLVTLWGNFLKFGTDIHQDSQINR